MIRLSSLFVLCLLVTAFVNSQILAIDYGTQYIKASLVHVGAGKTFSIVENPKSQRKFINSVTPHLFSSECIMERDFTRLRLCLKDQEVLKIASSFHISSLIFTTTLQWWKLSKRNSSSNTWRILKLISYYQNLF